MTELQYAKIFALWRRCADGAFAEGDRVTHAAAALRADRALSAYAERFPAPSNDAAVARIRALLHQHLGARIQAGGPAISPAPNEVSAARAVAGHTQTQAARVVWSTLRAWQSWEDGGPNGRRMPPAAWHLYLLRTGQHPTSALEGDLSL